MEKRILISRWFGPVTPIPVYDEASLSTVRNLVRKTGGEASLSSGIIERVGLIATELVRNQLRYAKHGYFAVRTVQNDSSAGLEVLAGDIGPGIADPALAIQGGRSTGGTLGSGLETVWRTADEVDIDDRLGEGLFIVARKFEQAPALRREFAIVSRPYPGEPASGDDAVVLRHGPTVIAAVADGLGHGREARRASARAIDVLGDEASLSLEDLFASIHAKLAETRGCAMSIARSRPAGYVDCASAGEVYTQLYTREGSHFVPSTPCVLGDVSAGKRTIRIETHASGQGSILVMFTDGLRSRASLNSQPMLLRQRPVVLAQHLLDSYSRANDDALVLVARLAG